MKRFLKYFIFTAVLSLAACTSDDNVDTADSQNTEDVEAPEGGDAAFGLPSDAISMDPHGSNDIPSEQVRAVIYEPLVAQDENLDIYGKLAEDWEQVDDTTWLFNLREDVTFHDGSEFNAEVVKANLERLSDPAKASPRLFLLEMIEEVNVIDDYTVEIVTEYPFSPLLAHLAHGAGKMISKDLIDADYQSALDEAREDMTAEEYYALREAGGDAFEAVADEIGADVGSIIETNPIGTGYMQFDSRSPGASTTLVKYDDYWDEPAKLDSAEFKVITETGSRIAELETGAAHFISDIQSANIDRIENTPDVSLERTESVAIDFIGFNTAKEPFDDKRVRQAITHAFDKETVAEGVYNGSGTDAVAALAPGVLGYDENLEGLDYDMDKARELLEESGHEDGFDLTMMVNDDNAERMDIAVILQESLAELNINVTIEQVEWGAYMEATGNGEHDMYMLGWSNATGDPDNGIAPLFHSDYVGPDGNRTFFENDALDELLDQGRRETDEAERAEIYQDAQEILVDEAPAIFVRHSELLNAKHDTYTGMEVDSYNIWDFRASGNQ